MHGCVEQMEAAVKFELAAALDGNLALVERLVSGRADLTARFFGFVESGEVFLDQKCIVKSAVILGMMHAVGAQLRLLNAHVSNSFMPHGINFRDTALRFAPKERPIYAA